MASNRSAIERMFHRKRTSSPFASSDLAATATIIIGSEQAEGVDADIGIGIVDATSWHFWPHNGAGSSDPTATHNDRKR